MDIKNNFDFYHGVLRFEDVNGSVKPMRFTEREMEVYNVSEARRTRAAAGAGESVVMMTDAKSITFDFDVVGISRKVANFGLIVDGFVRKPVIVAAPECGRYSAVIELDGNKHTVEIYLPHLVEIVIHSINIEGASVCEPIAKKDKIYFAYGDSITQGMESADPAAIYPVLVGRELGMEMFDFGVGGATFDPEQVVDNGIRPDVVTAVYGINDWLGQAFTLDEIKARVHEFCTRLTKLYAGVPIFVVSPFWTPDKALVKKAGTFCDVNEAILETVRGFDSIVCIDGTTLVPDNQAYFKDTAHPNELGFAHIALKLFAAIKNQL
nr:hypothetical protein [Clostridia bacterium]